MCLIVAGALRATLPADEFTLRWRHSVEKTLIEEHYRAENGKLALTEARIQGLGAGMDTPPTAKLQNGWWVWRPEIAPLSVLRLTRSDYTRDYDVCWGRSCSTLSALVGQVGDAVVDVTACKN